MLPFPKSTRAFTVQHFRVPERNDGVYFLRSVHALSVTVVGLRFPLIETAGPDCGGSGQTIHKRLDTNNEWHD